MDTKRYLRFMAKVDTGTGEDVCHLWQGTTDGNGYGLVSIGGRQKRAHRLMWEHANGRAIPSELMIRHDCGVRRCVNPRHLLIGTALDNAQDTKRHGRYPHGESHWAAKLSSEDAARAQRMRLSGMTYNQIARAIGISYTAVHYLLNGRTWKHLPPIEGMPKHVVVQRIAPEIIETARRMRDDERRAWREIEDATGYGRFYLREKLPRRTGYNPNPVILTPEEADKAVRLRLGGLSWTKLSRHFGNRISRMGLYYAWRDKMQWWREAEERIAS